MNDKRKIHFIIDLKYLLYSMALMMLLMFALKPAAADINEQFNAIKSNPNALYAFFKTMPKGGELHYHLAGGAYPEVMIALAINNAYCLDLKTMSISKPCITSSTSILKQLGLKPKLYDDLIDAWSMRHFVEGQESAHHHFFESFFKFIPLVFDHRAELLASIMTHAATQHELYMEIMIMPDNAHSTTFASLIQPLKSLNAKKELLLTNKAFLKNIQNTINNSNQILKNARHLLGCDSDPKKRVCLLQVNFQYYVLREQSLDKVFAQALNGFAAANASNTIVGVNLVQAEDGPISLRDYDAQMHLFEFLHLAYPNVHIALHAGELTKETLKAEKTATPNDLNFHIREAIEIGHAERIGHGVDVLSEHKSSDLLQKMAKKQIPVEINLTSNRIILNVFGKHHPLLTYLAHQVPVVLSTDDEGILRTDLTSQYVDAVLLYHLNYQTIKAINRNTLSYGFMPGKSIWQDNASQIPVKSCQDMESQSCLKYIQNNQKATLQWRLEQQLNHFEKNIISK